MNKRKRSYTKRKIKKGVLMEEGVNDSADRFLENKPVNKFAVSFLF